MGLKLAWKIFLAFCLVLLVVLGLGLWSLRATQELQGLNEALLARAIPAVQIQQELAELVPILARHEARGVILRDPAYHALHGAGVAAFRRRLGHLESLVDDGGAREVLGRIHGQLAEYESRVKREWAAQGEGRADQALALSEGPTRQASEALAVAIEGLIAGSRVEMERQVRAAGQVAHSARLAAGISLAVSLVVGLGLAAMVAVRIAGPIRELSRATERIARGEYDVPVAVRSRDEVGELAEAFRAMALRLGEAEAFKAELLANISHDIRSPLNSIGVATSLLQGVGRGPKEARWLGIIESDSRKVLRLSNQILDLAKLRAGAFQLRVARADLRRVVESAVQELAPEAEERGVALAVDLPDEPLPLEGDADRLQQVFANLLGNAVKFTPRGGRVTLAARGEASEMVASVADTGAGIPAEQLPHVFDRYRQAHQGTGGAGLGLAIVREFVVAHHGRVWVESREGEGTCFHVALPGSARSSLEATA